MKLTGGKACADCGEQIPPERLAVLANTPCCIFCQEQREGWGKFKRHTMNYFVESSYDTVETVVTVLRKGDAV